MEINKYLAYDIGGTNTRVIIYDDNNQILDERIRPTVNTSKEDFIDNILLTTEELKVNMNEISAIGMGVPGVCDRLKGYIVDLPNVYVKDIPIRDIFYKKYHKPLYLRNDAEVAALGEAIIGAGKGYQRVFFITISTGLGGALVIDEEVQDYVTEIGHTHFKYQDQYYEYEALASGTGLVKLAKLNKLNIASSKELFDLIARGDSKALVIKEEWLKILSKFLRMIQDSYLPEVITITGGVMKSKNYFFEDLKSMNPDIHIVECGLGEYAGLIGAALFAKKEFYK